MLTKMSKPEPAPAFRFYKASAKKPEIVDVPAMNFVMIDGIGDPNTSAAYKDALDVLYGISYTLKFALKKAEGANYKVAALEGLWWSDEMDAFLTGDRARWRWTMMIAQPACVTPAWQTQAMDELQRKKNPPALPLARFESFHEGHAAQIMHIGPYSAEAPTIQRLHEFIRAQGGIFDGQQHMFKHHEIYLGDPRRAAPERLMTVIRQPFDRQDIHP